MGCCQDDEIEPCSDDKSLVNVIIPDENPYKAIYWGSNSNLVLNESEIVGLQNTQDKLVFAGTYLCDANNYKYICYPNSFGSASTFINTSNGLNVPMATATLVSVGGITYRVERSYYPIVGAISIQIS